MISTLTDFIIPAALRLLPEKMDSPAAKALLLATAFQESKITYREQVNGPARGLWQFEENGIYNLRRHPRAQRHFTDFLYKLLYREKLSDAEILIAITHNDILAAGIARLNYWVLPVPLPMEKDFTQSWGQYLAAWNPGRPRQNMWELNYTTGWNLVRGYVDNDPTSRRA
jgi:hypothetical protein